MSVTGDLARELTVAPVGVALLDLLEIEHRDDVVWFETPDRSDPDAVDAAIASVATMSFGDLVHRLVSGATRVGGPWVSGASRRLERAYRLAPARATIATAVADAFGSSMRADLPFDAQQWWSSAGAPDAVESRFDRPLGVYCCGEFTWNALWTVSSPPAEVHDDLIDVWELFPGPISRWELPVTDGARVLEVHDPLDWAQLVTRYPRMVTNAHTGWELPGRNQDRAEVHGLVLASGGAAARSDVQVAMPDWRRVAEAYDGIHLSWAGMLACEGRVVDLPELGPNVVSMLRYWGSERTLWLDPVFGHPAPLPAAVLSGRVNGDLGIDATDATRGERDRRTLAALVGRDLFDP
jgi:hypothetical protein